MKVKDENKTVEPLNDRQLQKLGLRQPLLNLDQKVFQKTEQEKIDLKAAKRSHKLNN